MVAPCRDCTNRVLGCHDRCPKYQAFKTERAEARTFNHQMDNGIIKKYKRRRYKCGYDIRSKE